MASVSMRVQRWAAWAPGVSSPEQWRQWAQGAASIEAEGSPDVSFLPARSRRRLSRLTRMALTAAHRCLEAQPQAASAIRSVFASRHGELHRSSEILQAIAAGQQVSPTQFSHSVHNTAAGYFSMLHHNRGPTTAIAAGRDTFLAALLEAAGWLHFAPGEPILVVMADEPLPAIYTPFQEPSERSYGLALLLASPSETQEEPMLCGQMIAPAPPTTLEPELPQALAFLRWWLAPPTGPLVWHSETQSSWEWSRHGPQA